MPKRPSAVRGKARQHQFVVAVDGHIRGIGREMHAAHMDIGEAAAAGVRGHLDTRPGLFEEGVGVDIFGVRVLGLVDEHRFTRRQHRESFAEGGVAVSIVHGTEVRRACPVGGDKAPIRINARAPLRMIPV